MATVKHIVMWKLKGDTEQEKSAAIALVKRSFEEIADKIPGLISIEIGVDFSKADYACDVVLYSEFVDRESLLSYASHPEHDRVRQALGDIRIARYQVDYCPASETGGLS